MEKIACNEILSVSEHLTTQMETSVDFTCTSWWIKDHKPWNIYCYTTTNPSDF